jgi:EH domain-containing protein 1
VAVSGDKPFKGLAQFGTAFLNKFECSQCPSPILQNITFIDTPGVLSGDKQRIGRSYDFVRVRRCYPHPSFR